MSIRTTRKKEGYPGTLISMMYPTLSGKSQRSIPLSKEDIAELQEILSSLKPGAKLSLKALSSDYQNKRKEELRRQGKKEIVPTHVIEVLTSDELNQERQALQRNQDNDI